MKPPGGRLAMTAGEDASWLRSMAREVQLFDRSSTAERVADILRRRITEGDLPPGTRLSEEQLIEVLGVSRNTLREAFRLLTHEGLLVHQLHRGVFVAALSEEDLIDLYRLRRIIECAVVSSLVRLDPATLRPLAEEIADAEQGMERGDWIAVGTANMRFHRHLVGLGGSPRMDELTARLLAELRLVFHSADDPQRLHEPYVGRNRALLELLEAGDIERAAAELEAYLDDSEAQLLNAVRTAQARNPS